MKYLVLLLKVALVVLLLAPPLVLVGYAFARQWFFPQLLPAQWSLATWHRQLTSPQLGTALLNSVLVGALSTGLSLLVAYPAGRAMGLYRFPGKGVVALLLLLPTVVPAIAAGIGLNILFLRLGLAGTLVGVALVHLIPVLPYTVFALAAVFARYDVQYEQQATVLGAGRGQVLLRVTLPLIAPGLLVAGLFAFLVSWSQYLLSLLIGGGQVITLPMLLFTAVSGGNNASTAVIALIFALLPALSILLVGRYLGGTATHGGRL